MSLRPGTFKAAAATMLCCILLVPAGVSAEDKGTNNAPGRAVKKDGLKRMEEDLFRPMRNATPESPLDNIIPPQVRSAVRPAVPSQKQGVRDARQRQKNSIFITPEDLEGNETTEEIPNLKGYDATGQDKSKLSPLDKFYSDTDPDRTGKGRKGDSLLPEWDRRGLDKNGAERDADSSLPPGLAERESALKNIFGPSDENRRDSSAPFGLGPRRSFMDHQDFHKSRMDEYRQMLGLPAQPAQLGTPASPFAVVPETPRSAVPPRLGLPEGARPSQYNSGAQLGTLNPAFNVGALQDTTVKGYGYSSLNPQLPKPEPAKLPPPPSFSIPKRPF